MKAKKLISLLAGAAFIAAFAVSPAFAASDELYLTTGSSEVYVASQKDKGLISGTIDYLGSVVDVATRGTWETFDSATAVLPRRCGERITYRPSVVMNRGSRWVRRYKH